VLGGHLQGLTRAQERGHLRAERLGEPGQSQPAVLGPRVPVVLGRPPVHAGRLGPTDEAEAIGREWFVVEQDGRRRGDAVLVATQVDQHGGGRLEHGYRGCVRSRVHQRNPGPSDVVEHAPQSVAGGPVEVQERLGVVVAAVATATVCREDRVQCAESRDLAIVVTVAVPEGQLAPRDAGPHPSPRGGQRHRANAHSVRRREVSRRSVLRSYQLELQPQEAAAGRSRSTVQSRVERAPPLGRRRARADANGRLAHGRPHRTVGRRAQPHLGRVGRRCRPAHPPGQGQGVVVPLPGQHAAPSCVSEPAGVGTTADDATDLSVLDDQLHPAPPVPHVALTRYRAGPTR